MTSAPPDLLAFRAQGLQVTGLVGDAFGIAPDASHLRGGGYHVGVADIARIGKYHGPASAHVGSSTEDYSVRQLRDRREGANTAAAVDVGSAWRTGRSAWIRWNNLLYQEMRGHPERLPALRAINVALDGRTKQRFDQLHRDQGLILSTDTVDSHTHLEFWRDTEGRRGPTLARLVELMHAAVSGTIPAPTPTEDDMQLDDGFTIPNYDADPALPPVESTSVKVALGVASQRSWQAYRNTQELLKGFAELKAAVSGIQAGQIPQDAVTAAVLAAMQTPQVRQALVDAANAAEDS